MNRYWVYFMSNISNASLYIGVTNDLERRVREHKCGNLKCAFTNRYKCHSLVYYEEHNSVEVAILREKQLKNWKRCWKEELMLRLNPNRVDLAIDWYNNFTG